MKESGKWNGEKGLNWYIAVTTVSDKAPPFTTSDTLVTGMGRGGAGRPSLMSDPGMERLEILETPELISFLKSFEWDE